MHDLSLYLFFNIYFYCNKPYIFVTYKIINKKLFAQHLQFDFQFNYFKKITFISASYLPPSAAMSGRIRM